MHNPARLHLALLAVVGALALPTAAAAWTVTVNIHGAGGVFETPNSAGETRDQGSCAVDPAGKTEANVTACVLGSPTGLWNSGDVVRLSPLQNPDVPAYNAGWRFDKWVDGTDSGQVNCDPEDTIGDHTSPIYCEFEISQNLTVDLYFQDIAGPDTVFTNTGFASFTNSTAASIEFTSATDVDATFECKLDRPSQSGSYYACGGPADKSEALSGLTDGMHTFSVRGVDISGNVESTPASHSWMVDTMKPAVSLSFPEDWAYLALNAFTPVHEASDANLNSVRCALDFGALVICGPLSGLSDGPHHFTVRAVDWAANAEAETHYFIVDTLPPNTKITSGPSGTTTDRTPTFRFRKTTVEHGDVHFMCRLDDGAWRGCTSPKTYTVARGGHTLRIKAIDAAGNKELEPAVWRWRRV
jgi:hypothetical protein